MKKLSFLFLTLLLVSCGNKGTGDTPDQPQKKPQDPPTWVVTTHTDPISSMTLVLTFPDALLSSVDPAGDVVGVFSDKECLAVSKPLITEIGPRVYFRFQGPDATLSTTLHLRYYSAKRRAYFSASDPLIFKADAAIGSTDAPWLTTWLED